VPVGIFSPPNPSFNNFVMKIQYICFILILFVGFSIISITLLPIAFLKSYVFKIQMIFKANSTYDQAIRLLTLFLFTIVGLPMMLLSFVVDCYYFWLNNFREHLKKIVIEREPSSINNTSIKRIQLLCQKYCFYRIKAVSAMDFVKKFREDLEINSLL
jgi:hypothetical protein